MKELLIVGFFIWVNIQCKSQHFVPEFKTTLDSSNGSSLLKQCSRSTPEKVSRFYNPSPETISKMEQKFDKINSIRGRIQDLKSYGYQYLGIEIQGKKYIYVNAFPIEDKDVMEVFHKDWKTKPVKVCDGGESYWGIVYNVQKGKFSMLSINVM